MPMTLLRYPWSLPPGGAVLAVMAGLYLVFGLVGHDPWKADDVTHFGVAYGMLEGGGWLVPRLAGEPFLAQPPLYYWLGGGERQAVRLAAAAARRGAARLGGCRRPLFLRHGGGGAHPVRARCTQRRGGSARPGLSRPAGARPRHAAGAGPAGGLRLDGLRSGPRAGAPGQGRGLYRLGHRPRLPRRRPAGAVHPGPAGPAAAAGLVPLARRRARRRHRSWGWRSPPSSPRSGSLAVLRSPSPPCLGAMVGAVRHGDVALDATLLRRTGPLPRHAALVRLAGRCRCCSGPCGASAMPCTRRASPSALRGFAVTLVALGATADARSVTALPLLPPLVLLAVPAAGTLRRGAANGFDWFAMMAFSLFAGTGVAGLDRHADRMARSASRARPRGSSRDSCCSSRPSPSPLRWR
ncbi:MAG: hypothetical protein MZW92_79840 [Comamonadaceae bacterium]|nr:hypothetical protein [Comamonadaceae bacterium]